MLGWLGLLVGSAFGAYEIVSIQTTHPHPSLDRVVYEVEVGNNPLNRFSIIHVSKKHLHFGLYGKPVMLMSPFTLPGEFYEISETGRYVDSAAGQLAQANYNVWLVDQRRTELPPGACEAGVADCSVMAEWGFDALTTDALLALALVKLHHPLSRPVIGGFSAGANTALATVNRAPHAFSGLFLYEGTFYTEDPTLIAHNDAICTTVTDALESGAAYDPSIAVLGMVLTAAANDRSAPFPLPIFPPGTTNQQALLFVYGAPPPPGALSPTPGFVRLKADFQNERFVYANQSRLELVGPLFDSYGSLASMRDLACGLAGRDTSHIDRLDEFRGDVLVFVEGTGFGPALFETVSLFERADSVTIDHNPELGEADPYFHVKWKQKFLHPLTQWLRRTL